MTDDPEVAELPWAQNFNETFCFDPTKSQSASQEFEASDWTETRLAAFIETALGELAKFTDQSEGLPDWTWLHLSGLSKIWDAPFEYRLQLCDDEDDPEPPSSTVPASFEVDRQTDPDLIFGATCGAAAQGIIIDQVWSWVEAFLDEVTDRENCLVILSGVRGYPLGEHHSVGFSNKDLFSESMQIPLLLQPGKLPIGARDCSLVQPMTYWATIAHWLILDPDNQAALEAAMDRRPLTSNLLATHLESEKPTQRLPSSCFVSNATSAFLQVPRWTAVWRDSDDTGSMQPSLMTRLFLSPDDRWQQNDVASRASEVANSMSELREAWLTWFSEVGNRPAFPTLPECLKRPV